MADGELVKEDEVDVNPTIKQNVLIWETDAPIHRCIRHRSGKSLNGSKESEIKETIFFVHFSTDERRDFEIMFLIMIYVYQIQQIEKKSRELPFITCLLFLV